MTAATDWIAAAASVALAAAALYQLPLISRQVRELAQQIAASREADEAGAVRRREDRTLDICQRYDFDPVIEAATQRIAHDVGEVPDYRKASRRDIVVLLNYLDGIAIGIEQNLYVEAIVRDHLEAVVNHAVTQFITSGIETSDGLEHLVTLHRRWFPTEIAPYYRSA